MEIRDKIEKGFFGFWVKRYKVSFLAVFMIILAGLFSLFTIPKESSPDIKFGIISISTIYTGVNPDDIDSLITDKIEKEIDDIDGIKKITSRSSLGVSSINVELFNDANTRNVLADIKDAVDKVNLPEDAEDPSVLELTSSNELMFELLIYGDSDRFSKFDLIQKSQYIKNQLEGKHGIASIDLGGVDIKGFGGSNLSEDYEIKVLVNKEKLESLNLTLRDINNSIRSHNKNTPIGNYQIGDLNYDFRFEGELGGIEDLKKIVVKGNAGSQVLLGDIAKFNAEYKDDSIKKLGFFGESGYNYSSLIFNKAEGVNIFGVSGDAKAGLEDLITNDSQLQGLQIQYTKDMSELIIEDYDNLGGTAIGTLILVFLTILIFVGIRESIIASILIPLSFFITFVVLDVLGMSMNFLTNFSLVLTLGIAIDTVIVIIEGASEKIKLGYSKRAAIMLAVHDFKAPLIAGTLTTLVVFLPLMFLPGVMGKFLSFIPITVFSTLLAALVLALTISSALFVKIAKDSKVYHKDKKLEATFTKKQAEFLKSERIGKTAIQDTNLGLRDNLLLKLSTWYYNHLKTFLLNTKLRLISIFLPVALLILSFIFLSPNIGFTLFPATDEAIIEGDIEATVGTDQSTLVQHIPLIDDTLSKHPEIKVYYITVSDHKINLYIELLNRNYRKELGMRHIFDVEDEIVADLEELSSYGLNIAVQTLSNGPPTGKPIGVKLIASSSEHVDVLEGVAEEFKEYLKTIPGTKNASTSSAESPGQFVFKFKDDSLNEVGLTPDDIVREVSIYTSGLKSGSIKSIYEDNDIVLKIDQFEENLSPDDINNLIINTKIGKIRVGDFAEYSFQKAVSTINRENGKITIKAESDFESGVLPSDIQPQLINFAKSYDFPDGISFEAGGENEENKDLLVSTIKSLFIALFLIFGILVFQFNSFGQPAIILYSIILALLGVNIGLFVTGNPYSMTFGIGFIALTGVVVNDAIILIDRINKNLAKGIDDIHAVMHAGKSRLQPIIVTTLTTMFGVLPLAIQDEFWAGLGFTIVFGLFAGSSMTLFVIPALYYQIFLYKKEKPGLIKEKK